MNTRTILTFAFTVLLNALTAQAEFIHPGVAHSQASIDFVKEKIAANEEPWATAWQKLKDSRSADLSRAPEPHTQVERGPYNNPDIGSSEFSGDASAAYIHALCWAVSGEEKHAKKSMEIVDAWSGKLESISNHDAKLLVGMSGYKFCIAGELLRHTWDGWPKESQVQFEGMLRDIFYATIKDFYPSANGNWDASMLQTMLAMGVFLEDQPMFDRAKDYFLKGKGNGAIGMYFSKTGQCQETGRDQAHTQMGLEFLSNTCETAWIQGIDLYGALDNRLLKGFEYTAKYNLGNDVPYEPYTSFEGRYHYKTISDDSRGRLRPMYEKIFNHYHNRKGLDAPFTKQAALKLRNRQGEENDRRRRRRSRTSHLDTLMFAGEPAQKREAETLPPLGDQGAPQTLEALWADFDPRAEPLDIEILKEWEEDGVVMQVLRYRVGVFKGRKAMVAAIYGHAKGATEVPGLVQIHGGGQYADSNAVLTNAKRGYATISISWAGRISAPGYRVTPKEVQLFWDKATEDPNYKVTTDWGALDGYHAPSRNKGNIFPLIPEPAPWTLDEVKSPRNNAWFLCTLAARRSLTFLEKQPQVDADRLGVYGHSMGGKLTVLTAGSDDRVKAAAPSCGGISDRSNKAPLFRATLGDDPYLKRLTCPTVFLSPANDFHGRIHDLQTALSEIQSPHWRITAAAHHNHQDTAAYEVATQLWFDQHLKQTFTWPETPITELKLQTEDGIPSFSIRPDTAMPIASVNVFYTQDANPETDREGVINRYWHHAAATKADDTWTATLPLSNETQPLWVYANVAYALEEPVTGAGYYYRTYTTSEFNLSSPMTLVSSDDLKAANVKPTLKPSLVIETFQDDWEKAWFTYRPEAWGRRTHKVNDPLWAAPPDAKLSVQVRAASPNQLVIGLDSYAAETLIKGDNAWQTITLSPADFLDARGEALKSWEGIRELRLADKETLKARRPDATRNVGGPWKGTAPEFRELKWNQTANENTP